MRIRLDLAYDGTEFYGWQKQRGKRTVAEVVEERLRSVLGASVTLKGASRTDRGVHALAQVAHFDIEKTHIPPANIAAALNMVLPEDVRILKSAEAGDDFHARLSAKGKTYLYKMFVSAVSHPLYCRTHHSILPPFDAEKAGECLSYIIGTYDYTSFCYADKSEKSKIRTITGAKVIAGNYGNNSGIIAASPYRVDTAKEANGGGLQKCANSRAIDNRPYEIDSHNTCRFDVADTVRANSVRPCQSEQENSQNIIMSEADEKEGRPNGTNSDSAHFPRDGYEVIFEISGNGFLHNMVRIIAGTVIKITKNKKFSPADMKTILEARDRQKAASTAPACGLYLKEIFY